MGDKEKGQNVNQDNVVPVAQEAGGTPEAEKPQKLHPLSTLAVKFAWRIGLALLILFAAFGAIVASMVHGEINDQINAGGARIVNALTAIDLMYWQAARDQRDFRMTLRYSLIHGHTGEPHPEQELSLKENPLQDAITMGGLDASDIVNVIVTDTANLTPGAKVDTVMSYASRGEGATARFDHEEQYKARNSAGRLVDTGIFMSNDKFTEITKGGGTETYDVRQFRKPILDRNGNKVGNVILFVSAKRIGEVTSRFVTSVVIACIIALVAAMGVSFLLSSLVTRPVRRLVQDMRVVSRGNLDHKAFGYKNDEVGLLAQTFNMMTRGLKEAQQKEFQRRALTRELEIAKSIQTSLLPSSVPKLTGFEIHAVYRPAKEVGGDYYDFIPIDERHWGVMMADVSGKGIPGSMVMTMVRSLIRYEARGNNSPADTLRKTNTIIARDIKKGVFVTAFYVIVDLERRAIKMSCAGHNPMLYWHARGGTVKTVKPEGLALGIVSGPAFDKELQEVVINMELNDRMILYTDGITEAMNAKNEEFGMERFARLVAAAASKGASDFSSSVVTEIDKYSAGVEQHDDITMVNMRLLA
jgi:serine phosphatase RsbU (regulator of sigma subunit)